MSQSGARTEPWSRLQTIVTSSNVSELNRILEALRKRNVQPALQWAVTNRSKLNAQKSQLELKLHRLQFLNLLSRGATFSEAVEYARQNFQHLAERHEKDVQALMGCLLYMNNGGLQQSPYARFLDNSLWTDICQVSSGPPGSVLSPTFLVTLLQWFHRNTASWDWSLSILGVR